MRSGGHSVAGLSTCEGGILIDLAGLKQITVDPEARDRPRRRRRAVGRVRRRDAGARAAHARRPRHHHRRRRLHHRRRLRLDVVASTASPATTCSPPRSCSRTAASSRPASADEPDLFWGIRGGGGNFGIVTEFEFRLHQLGPIVLAGLALWPIERAARGHARAGATMSTAPRRALDRVRDPDGAARAVRARLAQGPGGHRHHAAMYVGDPEPRARA